MISTITTSQTLADYSERVVLDGSEFLLRLFWNQREAKWYLSIYDSSEAPIALGIKVVANRPLLSSVLSPNRPPGEIFATVLDNGPDPGFAELGGRVLLTYVDASEFIT